MSASFALAAIAGVLLVTALAWRDAMRRESRALAELDEDGEADEEWDDEGEADEPEAAAELDEDGEADGPEAAAERDDEGGGESGVHEPDTTPPVEPEGPLARRHDAEPPGPDRAEAAVDVLNGSAWTSEDEQELARAVAALFGDTVEQITVERPDGDAVVIDPARAADGGDG